MIAVTDLQSWKRIALVGGCGVTAYEVCAALFMPHMPPPSRFEFAVIAAMFLFAGMAHWREAATQRYLPLFKLIPWALIGDSFYRIYRADFSFDVAVPVLAVFFGCAMISETRRELLWYFIFSTAAASITALLVENPLIPVQTYVATVMLIGLLSYMLIGARLRDQQELARSQQILESAGQLARVGGWEHDPATGTMRWTRSMFEIFGVSDRATAQPDEILKRFDADSYGDLVTHVSATLNSGVPMDYEREWATESGPRWIRTIGSRIRSGRTNRVVGASQDITAYKRTQHDLVEARDLSERALQARSQFLANMSHEIRTPMNGVIGMTSLLQATTLTDEQQDMVETVKVSGESLMSIINDILDFSKIDAGRIELEEQAFSLRECVTSVLDLTTPTARDKNLNIGASITSDTPDRLLGDVTRLRQVLVNLLSNAVKFTERGSIQIDVQSLNEADKKPQSGWHAIEFKVSDTGVGIDPAARPRLFQPFEQEDASITRRFGGTGLGLAICKDLVELMGGEIWVDSTPGQGSTFGFVLTLRAAGDDATVGQQPHASNQPLPRRMKVLLAEDNPVNQRVRQKILDRLGCDVDLAANGHEVIDATTDDDYDVILMDVQMPGMDGLEATRHLRRATNQTRIVAMTANVLEEEREACFDAGMDDFIAKPITVDALRNVLENC
jgi:signal transduction histidine kinase